MRKMFVALSLMAMISAPLRAELKYTTHLEVKKSEAPPSGVNPMIGMMADSIMKQLVPEGAADIISMIGDKGARVEYVQAAMGQVAGSISLAKPDGTFIVMNPKEKTYWKTTSQALTAQVQAAGLPTPEVNTKRTGKFDNVAGVKCEVVEFDWRLALPIPEQARASLPPDFPTTIAMKGDSCTTTDQYQKYAEIAAKSAGAMMSAMGLDKITQGGISLRQSMQMMGFEMRSAVTSIGEEAVAETLFDIPADYKEVPAPTAGK
jgi:hypothetical protein